MSGPYRINGDLYLEAQKILEAYNSKTSQSENWDRCGDSSKSEFINIFPDLGWITHHDEFKLIPSYHQVKDAYAVCESNLVNQLAVEKNTNWSPRMWKKNQPDPYLEYSKCMEEAGKKDAMHFLGQALAMYALSVEDKTNIGCFSRSELAAANEFALLCLELLKEGRLVVGTKLSEADSDQIMESANHLIDQAHKVQVENYKKDTGNNY
jgi:hypothetical protein